MQVHTQTWWAAVGKLRGWGDRKPTSWFWASVPITVPWTSHFTSLSLSFCITEIGLGEHRLAARLPWDWTLALALTSYGNLGSLLPSLSPHFLVCKMGTPRPTSQGSWEDERR